MPCENYVIPLTKVYDNKPRTRRANHAITVIFDFFKKHARKDKKDIIISQEVNEHIWSRSIQKPPRKVAVSIKIENEKLYVFLKDSKAFKEFGKVPEKKVKASKTEDKVKPVKTEETKNADGTVIEKTEVKKDEKPKVEKSDKKVEKPKKETKVKG